MRSALKRLYRLPIQIRSGWSDELRLPCKLLPSPHEYKTIYFDSVVP